jgi:hypothetical protein
MTIEQQCSVEFSCGGKKLNTKDFRKEIDPIYSGKSLLHKAVHD